ncbi:MULTISPECIES: TetR/AcrR family transcriptional regulator [Arthrobacter]|uniref:TetR/AcrR family transcriptional regulator n=1 Tax=Arthrobacter terricola TaxID=2547396 RepID=A0A4R5KNV5_9MICC|nr:MULTISPECIES: TetR/AcrR family transcriptional regulator [Arthrobacter]MBT8160910.1 TetR/AcrR family transcriptional regulator [Arthrobacter sp. GN70]TDF97341.1 TetR/AcrR family transcriptional regulator [Arthrobacter terricola]
MTLADAPAGLRVDMKRNRSLLVSAAGRLFGAGRSATMSDVASAAGISTATAYRHFASVDDILAAYRFEVGRELLEFTKAQESCGLELLKAVCRKWVELVVQHGESMVHTRSAEGYLARVRGGAYYLTVQAEALERPLEEACKALGIPYPGDEALFLWNGFFDPREVFDLIRSLGLSVEHASARLVRTLTAALAGWSGSRI